ASRAGTDVGKIPHGSRGFVPVPCGGIDGRRGQDSGSGWSGRVILSGEERGEGPALGIFGPPCGGGAAVVRCIGARQRFVSGECECLGKWRIRTADYG